MHWLTQFEQHIVGDVNDCINGADAAATQFFFHPQRSWRFNVDAFHNAAQIARAGFHCFDLNRQDVANGCGYRRDLRLNQWSLVQYSHITCHTDDTQAVGAVRRNADFDGVIVKLQVFADIGANWRIGGQFDNAAMIVGNAQLGERAQHAFRRFTTQFRRFNFKVARQYGTHGCHSHFQALTAVRRATDDIQQAVAAYIHFGDAQFVSVRVLSALNHFTHHHAVERARNRFHTVNFQTRHRDLV